MAIKVIRLSFVYTAPTQSIVKELKWLASRLTVELKNDVVGRGAIAKLVTKEKSTFGFPPHPD